MLTLYGYLAIALYFSVVFFLVGLLLKKYTSISTSRKVVHILTGLSFFIYDYFIGNSYHQIIICGFFLIFAILSKRFSLLRSIENNEKHNYGTIFYASSLLVIMTISYFIPELYQYVMFPILALSFGDGFSSIFGKLIKSPKIHNNKTLAGFIACFLFTLAALSLYNFLLAKIFTIYEILLLSIVAAIAEEVDKGVDNITITLSVFALAYLLDKVDNILIPTIIFCAVFAIAFFSKVMTLYGAILASLIGAFFYYFGGLYPFIFLLSGYVILIIIDIIRKIKKASVDGVVKKAKGKDVIQVAANGAVSIILIVLYGIFKSNVLLVASLIVVANSFVDSVASDVGSLSKKTPYDIFKKKFVSKGISGGITFLGTFSSCLAAVIFAVAIMFITNTNWLVALCASLIMIVCCFVDTLFGSLIQVKYQCQVCRSETEKEIHCDTPTKKIGGFRYIDNDIVNIISSVICGSLTMILWIL